MASSGRANRIDGVEAMLRHRLAARIENVIWYLNGGGPRVGMDEIALEVSWRPRGVGPLTSRFVFGGGVECGEL